MRAAAVLCLLSVLVTATLATPAQGAGRLARAAAALERSALFVHPDLLWLLPAQERAQVERVLRGSSAPVRVAVLPVIPEDESFGDGERVLFGIQEHLDRRGLLVVVDEKGWFELASFGVPREIAVPFELAHVDFQAPPLIRERLARLVELVERSPRGPPTTPQPHFLPISEVDGDDNLGIWQVLLAGAIFGAGAHVLVRLALWFGGGVMRGFRAR